MGYWMHRTYTRFIPKYLPFSLFSLFSPFLIIFFLATITNVEIAKIDTRFLTFFFKTLADKIAFSFIKKTFDIKKILFFFFDNDVDTC